MHFLTRLMQVCRLLVYGVMTVTVHAVRVVSCVRMDGRAVWVLNVYSSLKKLLERVTRVTYSLMPPTLESEASLTNVGPVNEVEVPDGHPKLEVRNVNVTDRPAGASLPAGPWGPAGP
jgi:hypothetical protein